MNELKRPVFVTDEHLEYLDDLRESGVVNMFGAWELLEKEYPYLSHRQAIEVNSYWARTFSQKTR